MLSPHGCPGLKKIIAMVKFHFTSYNLYCYFFASKNVFVRTVSIYSDKDPKICIINPLMSKCKKILFNFSYHCALFCLVATCTLK